MKDGGATLDVPFCHVYRFHGGKAVTFQQYTDTAQWGAVDGLTPALCLRYAGAMPLKSIRAWLGIDSAEEPELTPLRETLDALDHLEPDRARYLAAFAYLLGRVAHVDQHVSPKETEAMEALVAAEGHLPPDQAAIVVQMAKTSSHLFGGTANFLVAREFSTLATYDDKRSLVGCLFALSAADEAISTAEEAEIHRIAQELKVDRADLIALRVAHRRHLPGMSREP